MTATLPADVLYGRPEPTRTRWQPLRAGILGLFRYDEQEFTFHSGRLLLRGNNGSGKSMALEVLLPFVLDADLSPERLSTFGGRERGMYLWLLGHEKNTDRSNARGYVWVEFGRRDGDESEYFTVGAGLETSRATKKVTPWYFTTRARIGEHVVLGGPGTEPLGRAALADVLREQDEAGQPGAVHRDPTTHRHTVNRTLYGLEDGQFGALRRTLLQLRRPKLSDRLSERDLAEVLRDSLPPVDRTVTDELADGFERLDRHQEEIEELRLILRSVGRLLHTYRDYARRLTAHHASAVTAAETGLDGVRERRRTAEEAAEEAGRKRDSLNEQTADHERDARTVASKISALRDSAAYQQGLALEPLRQQAESLEDTAERITGRAAQEEARAGRMRIAAKQDEESADTAAATEQRRAEQAERESLTVSDPTLHGAVRALVSGLHDGEPHQDRVDGALADIRRLCEQVTTDLAALATLVEDADRLRGASRSAAGESQAAEQALADAEADLAAQVTTEQAVLDTYLTNIDRWLSASPQLRRSDVGPPAYDGPEPEVAVDRWTREAGRARDGQLRAAAQAHADAGRHVDQVSAARTDVTGALDGVHTAYRDTDRRAVQVRSSRERFADSVRRWLAQLVELVHAGPLPPALTAIVPATLTRAEVAEWAAVAAQRRVTELSGARERAVARASELDQQIATDEDEERRLLAGGLPHRPAPEARLAARDGRAGAPFYLLVDFADVASDHIGRRAQAKLEAALVGSGLADAWVSPDGIVMAAEDGSPLLDVQLDATSAPVGHSLAAAMRPDPTTTGAGAPVPSNVVAALLHRIGLAVSATDVPPGGLILGRDGTWSAGPMRGAYRLDSPGLVGAASREEERLRRLDVVRQRLAESRSERDTWRDREIGYARAIRLTEEERTSLPDDAEATAAAGRFDAAVGDLLRAGQALADGAESLHTLLGPAAAAVRRAGTAADRQIPPTAFDVTTPANEALSATRSLLARTGPNTDQFHDWVWRGWSGPSEQLASASAAMVEVHQLVEHLADEVVATGETLDVARRDLDTELDRRPDPTALIDARATVQRRVATRDLLAEQLAARRAAEATLQTRAAEAATVAEGALHLAGLGGRGAELSAMTEAARRYRQVAEDWASAAGRAADRAARAGAALAAAVEAELTATDVAEEAERARRKSDEVRTRYRTLEERAGEPYQRLVAELGELEDRGAELDRRIVALREEGTECAVRVAEASARLESLEREQTAAEEIRRAAVESFVTVVRLGVLAVADLKGVPDVPTEDSGAAERAPTGVRAVRDLARLVLAAVPRERGLPLELERAANRVAQDRHEVETGLKGRVTIRDHWEDGVLLLNAVHNGRSRPLDGTREALAADLDAAEKLLENNETELFERFLSDEVRMEVTGRIRAAGTLVKQMNSLMSDHPTSSGITVRLDWSLAGADVDRDVVDLLAKPPRLLFDSEREALENFFRARIGWARGVDSSVPWRQRLAELLDYRRWYHFRLQYRRYGGGWATLGTRQHATLSGGEKAVALHIPLFAAAATHCEASRLRVAGPDGADLPGCPRLILLDEVFAGVDQDNRGALFDIIRTLDLDLMATSESEQGLYAELDGLAVYHLVVDDTASGVLAVRSVWDGEDLYRLLDVDLHRSTPPGNGTPGP